MSLRLASARGKKKIKRRKEVFPLDCEKAYQMGVKFAKNTLIMSVAKNGYSARAHFTSQLRQ